MDAPHLCRSGRFYIHSSWCVVDDIDFNILGQVFRQPLIGWEALGREVGLTRNAVARRVRMMEQSRLRLRWMSIPHPTIFGARAYLSLFGPRENVDATEILGVPDVVGFDHNFDGLVPVTYYTRDRQPPPGLVAYLGGPMATFDASGPGPATPHLNRMEWKIMEAAIQAPRAGPAELARICGLGAKTVAKHRARMLQDGTLRIAATVQEGAADIPIFRAYLQGHPDPERLQALIPGSMKLETTAEPPGQVWLCKTETTSGMMAAAGRLRTIANVDDVKIILTHQIEWASEKLQNWCRVQRDGMANDLTAA